MSPIFTIPYTPVQIPAREGSPSKIVYSPILKTFLFNKGRPSFSFESIVDSGADFCVFPAELGELTGLEVRSGEVVPTKDVSGRELLYFHKVKVGIVVKEEMFRFSSYVGFSYKMNTGLLGRKGFFDIFDEIHFNQKTKMFRLKGGHIKTEPADFIDE